MILRHRLSLFALALTAAISPTAISQSSSAPDAEDSALADEIQRYYDDLLRQERRVRNLLLGGEDLHVDLAQTDLPSEWRERRLARTRVMQANQLGIAGQWDWAEDLLREAMEIHPDSPALATRLATAIWNQGRHEESLEVLRGAVETDPEATRPLIEFALRLQEAGESDEAVEMLERALEHQPRNATLLQALAMALIELGREDEGLDVLRDLRNASPNNLHAVFLLATVAERVGAIEDAIESYEEIIEARPELEQTYRALADLHMREGNRASALEVLGRALIRNPEGREINVAVQRALGMGNRDAYLRWWANITVENPDEVALQLAYVRRLINADRPDEAVAVLETLAERRPSDAQPLQILGGYLHGLDRSEEALPALRRAMELDPLSDETADTYFEALLSLHRVDEAVAVIDQATSPAVGAHRHSRLAETLALSGDEVGAEAEFLEAIDAAPDNPLHHTRYLSFLLSIDAEERGLEAALTSIEQIGLSPSMEARQISLYLFIDEFKEAISEENVDRVTEVLSRAADENPTAGNLRVLALFHQEHNPDRPDLAREALARAWTLAPDTPGRVGIIRLHMKAGDLDRAAERLAEAEESDPGNAELVLWRGTLSWLTGDEDAARATWDAALREDLALEVLIETLFAMRASEWNDEGLTLALTAVRHLGIFQEQPVGDPVNLYRYVAVFEESLADRLGEVEEALWEGAGEEPGARTLAVIAQFYDSQDRPESAREQFAASHRAAPDDAEWAAVLGSLCTSAGHLALAEQILRDGLETDDEERRPQLLALLGEVLFEQDRLAEAHEQYLAAYESKSDDLGWVFGVSGQVRDHEMIDTAETILLSAIESHPDNDMLHYELGFAYDVGDRTEDAERAFRRAIELNPDNYFALNHLGYMFTEENIHLDEALELARRAVALSDQEDIPGGNGFIVDSLGWAHYRLGNYDEAIRWLREAVRRAEAADVPDGVFHDHLGDALHAGGDTSDAVGEWEQAVELFLEVEELNAIADVCEKILRVEPDHPGIAEVLAEVRAGLGGQGTPVRH